MSARDCRCSPAMVKEDKDDEAVPEGCSPEYNNDREVA
jgi:hypothetical protein